MINRENLPSRMISKSGLEYERWQRFDYDPNGVLAMVSAGKDGENFLFETVINLRAQCHDADMPLRLVVGMNDGHQDSRFIAGLKREGLSWHEWENIPGGSPSLLNQQKTADSFQVDIVYQLKGERRTGKVGMIRDMIGFVKDRAVNNWQFIPSQTLMMDVESRFTPSAADLVSERDRDAGQLMVAGLKNGVFSSQANKEGEYINPQVPISLFHELCNGSHPYRGYLTGGGYIGSTSRVLSMMETVIDIFPGGKSEDGAMAALAAMLNVPVQVSSKIKVDNRVVPLWEKELWRQQAARWVVGTRSVREAIGNCSNPEKTEAKMTMMGLLALALCRVVAKAAAYQPIDSRSLPAAAVCLQDYLSFRRSCKSIPSEDVTNAQLSPAW
jgi:hypothetical protein